MTPQPDNNTLLLASIRQACRTFIPFYMMVSFCILIHHFVTVFHAMLSYAWKNNSNTPTTTGLRHFRAEYLKKGAASLGNEYLVIIWASRNFIKVVFKIYEIYLEFIFRY